MESIEVCISRVSPKPSVVEDMGEVNGRGLQNLLACLCILRLKDDLAPGRGLEEQLYRDPPHHSQGTYWSFDFLPILHPERRVDFAAANLCCAWSSAHVVFTTGNWLHQNGTFAELHSVHLFMV
jgi:hypothetical protein